MINKIRNAGPGVYIAVLLILAGGLLLAQVVAGGWSAFETCPNRDVLSWDANLRFLTVLDMRRDLGEGDVLEALRPIFDSPTWPALRPVLALMLFLIAPGGPDVVLDVAFTYFCFVVVFASMAVLALRVAWTPLRGAAVWLAASSCLLFMNQIFAFALSAMLEIQGMLFSVLVAFFLYVLFADRAGNERTAAADGKVTRATVVGLFISIQGLYHTKYPYGVMLLLGLAALEVVRLTYARNPALPGLPGRVLFLGRPGKTRLVAYGLFVLIAVLALGGVRVLPAGLQPAPKAMRNILFAATLLAFIDFNLAVYRGRRVLRETLPVRFRALYWTGLFPAVVWMLVHPDRFAATLGTRDHVQDASRSFARALFGEVWISPALFIVLTGAALVYCFLLLVHRLRSRTVEKSAIITANRENPTNEAAAGNIEKTISSGDRALAALIALWFIQGAVLELTTPNKQLRHVYHLLPAALVLFTAALARVPELTRAILAAGGKSRLGTFAGRAVFLFMFGLVVWLAYPGLRAFAAGEGFRGRQVCFTGTDPWTVDPARRLAAEFQSTAGEPTISINLLHRLFKPDGSWPAGRYIATDIDLLLRLRAVGEGGDLRFDSPRLKNWRGASRLLLIADRCRDGNYENLISGRAGAMGYRIEREGETAIPDRELCMTRYRLLPAKPDQVH